MKITNSKYFVALGIMAIVLSACSPTGSTTVTPATRVATQTPWIIYVPVTVTPEPATITPLPTAEVRTTPSRTPTRAPVAVKPAATATKPPVAAPPPTVTKPPACNYGTVTPYFPENGTTRTLNPGGTSGPAFEFKWNTPLQGVQDATIGYRIDIVSKRGNQQVNGDVVYVSHNKFIEDGKYIYEGPRVRLLAGGQEDNTTVIWQVTIIKITGSFDPQGRMTGSEMNCGAPSAPQTIGLVFN